MLPPDRETSDGLCSRSLVRFPALAFAAGFIPWFATGTATASPEASEQGAAEDTTVALLEPAIIETPDSAG